MPAESKRARFVNLAEGRMTKALNDIRLIGNLGTGNLYEYTAADVDAMRTRLNEQINAAFAKFKGKRRGVRPEFTLPAAVDSAEPSDAAERNRDGMNGTHPLNL